MATIRLWKLGSLSERIIPTKEAVERFANILLKKEEGKDLDIIWDGPVRVDVIRDCGEVEIVAGPGIRLTKEGGVVKVEKEE